MCSSFKSWCCKYMWTDRLALVFSGWWQVLFNRWVAKDTFSSRMESRWISVYCWVRPKRATRSFLWCQTHCSRHCSQLLAGKDYCLKVPEIFPCQVSVINQSINRVQQLGDGGESWRGSIRSGRRLWFSNFGSQEKIVQFCNFESDGGMNIHLCTRPSFCCGVPE